VYIFNVYTIAFSDIKCKNSNTNGAKKAKTTTMIITNEQNLDKKKPAQGGLHGVLGYIQTAGNLLKGDAIAPLKVDPFIRLCINFNKNNYFYQILLLREIKGGKP